MFLLTKTKKYYYDWQAVAEPIAPATAERLKSGVGNEISLRKNSLKGVNDYGEHET